MKGSVLHSWNALFGELAVLNKKQDRLRLVLTPKLADIFRTGNFFESWYYSFGHLFFQMDSLFSLVGKIKRLTILLQTSILAWKYYFFAMKNTIMPPPDSYAMDIFTASIIESALTAIIKEKKTIEQPVIKMLLAGQQLLHRLKEQQIPLAPAASAFIGDE